jgi:tRNA dimethylallyltransferase
MQLSPNNKKLIVIAGPTAIGKTALAIAVAKYLQASIVSADSRQCYKEMNIGVARPTVAELNEVSHYFIASHSITNPIDVAGYEQYALATLNTLFVQHDYVVCVGGTGLYLKALLEGIDIIPPVTPDIALYINEQVHKHGVAWLTMQLQEKDPAFITAQPTANNHRYQRALGVLLSYNKSILTYQQHTPQQRNFNVQGFHITMPRPQLYERINNRVLLMLQEGLVQEVATLLPYKEIKPLQTIGYKEVFEYLNGAYDINHMTNTIQQHTRNYAKRQITWFTHQTNFECVAPDAKKIIEKLI